MNVHDHGPENVDGLACREQLIGECQLKRLIALINEAEQALNDEGYSVVRYSEWSTPEIQEMLNDRRFKRD